MTYTTASHRQTPFLNLYQKVKKKVKPKILKTITPTEAISQLFKTDSGMPFLFIGREYLKAIYNGEFRYLVIVASRQAEKSSLLAKLMLLNATLGFQDSLLYVTAKMSQVAEFVNRKINKQFALSLQLRKFSFGSDSRNNSSEKILKNGSSMSFRAVGSNADSARGIPAREIYMDEVQSIDPDSIPVVMECAHTFPTTSKYYFAGTPLSKRNILSRKYAETCQNEWIITCQNCQEKNPPLGIKHIDLSKPYLFCCHCGERMEAMYGEWVAQNPEATKVGFRICRLMTPNATWRTEAYDGILDKYESYPEAQFFNEVLGLPYDQGTVPITEEEILANCGDHEFIDVDSPPKTVLQRPSFGAVDWAWSNQDGGQSYTIFAIASLNIDKIEILYVKRFFGPKYHDPENVLREIAAVSNRWNVDAIATDFGVGHKENLRLTGQVNAKVFEMQYVSSDKEWVWDKPTQCFRVGRTVTLDIVFNRLKKQLYKFPKAEFIQPFAEDILNVYIEYDPNFKRVRYLHSGSGPDDFLHLLNYLSIVIEQYFKRKIR